ncbi:MAG TPA: hypothetical protein VK550_19810 [Polyangiaceae bacterium]|nr:hypothetical protein [Polyangiaceae bacterium]
MSKAESLWSERMMLAEVRTQAINVQDKFKQRTNQAPCEPYMLSSLDIGVGDSSTSLFRKNFSMAETQTP